uniref:Angiomotin C-terminal domain-containing protein n=1 Tax=Strongyloides stercoralis TaxID=6248 RepID=A0A913I900_STRER
MNYQDSLINYDQRSITSDDVNYSDFRIYNNNNSSSTLRLAKLKKNINETSDNDFSKSCSPFRSTNNLIENKNYATASLTLGRRPTFSGHLKPYEKTKIKTYASTGHLALKIPDPVYECINDITTTNSNNTVIPNLNNSVNYSQSTNTLIPHTSVKESSSNINLKNNTLSILQESSREEDYFFDQTSPNNIIPNQSLNNKLLEEKNFYEDCPKQNSIHRIATFSHCGTLPLNKRNKFVTDILDNTYSLKRKTSMRIKDENEGTIMSKSSIDIQSGKNDGKEGKNLSTSKSFKDKLSKSFFDLTHGSQDRLQRWKTKLQSGRKGREKDSSCPPPKERVVSFCEMPSTSNTSLNSIPKTGNINIFTNSDTPIFIPNNDSKMSNKNTEKMYKNIRPLHTSKSLNNAMYTVGNKSDIPINGLIKSSSFRETNKIKRTSSSSNFNNSPKAFLNISLGKESTKESDLTILDNNFYKDIKNIEEKEMEHRTLRVRDNNAIMQKSTKSINKQEPSQHEKNMKSLQELVKTIESYPGKKKMNESDYHLPPPARIMPYSGIKPQDNAIIRPIAFRPIGTSEPGTVQKHFSITKPIPKVDIQGNQNNNSNIMKTSPNSRDSYASAIQDNQITNISKGNPPPYQSSFAPSRPKPLGNNLTVSSYSNQKYHDHQPKEENDYDTVAEYIDKDKICSDSSETYSYFPSNIKNSFHVTGNMSSSTHSSSMKSIGSRSPGCNRNLTNQSQITPSPSDSGIVDYETLIKDKENELNNVRQTMEQNEEILIRVYQEKEKSFRIELGELKQKLRASQQGENALRNQLQKSEEERERLSEIVNNLQNDKINMNKKCSQIEKELYAMRSRIQDMATEKLMAKNKSNLCDNCGMKNKSQPNGGYGNLDGNSQYYQHSPPIPAPRLSKEIPCNDKELRNEVDALRSEISMLREQLFEQFGMVNVKKDNTGEVNGNKLKTIPNNSFSNQINGNIKKPIISDDRLI